LVVFRRRAAGGRCGPGSDAANSGVSSLQFAAVLWWGLIVASLSVQRTVIRHSKAVNADRGELQG
jgi:hypothetical protein